MAVDQEQNTSDGLMDQAVSTPYSEETGPPTESSSVPQELGTSTPSSFDETFMVSSEDGREYVVYPFEGTVANVDFLWEQIKKHKVMFNDHGEPNKETFLQFVFSPRTVIMCVDRVGIVYYTNVTPGYYADGHFFFWDKVLRGRQKVILSTTAWLMQMFSLHRINVQIPRYAFSALRRVYRMGLRLEGMIRDGIKFNGRWADLFIFGILEDEMTTEALEEGRLARTQAEEVWHGALDEDDVLMHSIVKRGDR